MASVQQYILPPPDTHQSAGSYGITVTGPFAEPAVHYRSGGVTAAAQRRRADLPSNTTATEPTMSSSRVEGSGMMGSPVVSPIQVQEAPRHRYACRVMTDTRKSVLRPCSRLTHTRTPLEGERRSKASISMQKDTLIVMPRPVPGIARQCAGGGDPGGSTPVRVNK